MIELGGPVAELLASTGAIAAGGAFIGTALALVSGRHTRLDRPRLIDRIGEMAATMSVGAIVLALIEQALT